MIYPFECPVCGEYSEVVRCAADSAQKELCKCGASMNRVWTSPMLIVPQEKGYYNHGLGCYVKNKRDVRDAIKKIGDGGSKVVPRIDEKGKTYTEKVDVPGREIVEIGNEKKAAVVKHKQKTY